MSDVDNPVLNIEEEIKSDEEVEINEFTNMQMLRLVFIEFS